MALPEIINYDPIGWVNNQSPAINATNLNKIDTAITTAYTTINALIGEIDLHYYTKTEVYNKTETYNQEELYSKAQIDACFTEINIVEPD